MFRGLAAVEIDVKGRVTVPSQYRKAIMDEASGSMVLTIDTEERCLLLYNLPQWQAIEDQLVQLPSYNLIAKRVRRLLIGHAVELELDRHGRILLPQWHCDYAGLTDSVVLVGQGSKIELWGESQWQLWRNSWMAADMDDSAGIPHEIMSLVL